MRSTNVPARPPRRQAMKKVCAWMLVIATSFFMLYGQDLFDWYAGAPQGEELLFCAAGNGTVDEIDRALSQGADINARGTAQLTPLIVAAGSGDVENVRLLLDRHADPNLEALTGLTALYNAVVADNSEVIELLLVAGADLNKVTNNETALDTAIRLDRQNSIRTLKAHSARRACDVE